MTDGPNARRPWRPRFTIRTLAIVVTLVCAYAACWGPTKKWGIADVRASTLSSDDDAYGTWAVAPLIVMQDEFGWATFHHGRTFNDYESRRYYFWFFGYVAKLPYERELPDHMTPQRVHGGVI